MENQMGSAFEQLLVHFDDSPAAAGRLKFARGIATRFSASLTALYGVAPTAGEVPYAADVTLATLNAVRDVDAQRIAAAKATYDIALAQSTGARVQWAEITEGAIAPAFAEQALYADLAVLPQHNRREGDQHGVPADLVETVVIGSGRPALVMPYIGWTEPVGETIAIAWKPSRESMRAVRAAEPFLRTAKHVHVLTWGEPAANAIGGASLDLDSWLRARGLEATWHCDPVREPDHIGEAILSGAADYDCDLLVMGCYGTSRLREWAFGGATRTVLDSMTLPVLMAH
jgi:nucleotide-binding universal stress UspA family protein